MSANQAAWLIKADTPLEVREAPMPTPGPNEIAVRNFAVAINPLDTHMQKTGIFVQQWPAIFGCDVAGEVYQVGAEAGGRFKKGDRVIGHTVNLVSGRPEDGAYALHTVVQADKAAILPDEIPFTTGVAVPFALEAAVCALSVKVPGPSMPGVSTPALGLPYPSLDPKPLGKTLVIYGGSSSVGSMTTQIATAAGIRVVAICSAHNFALARAAGAASVFDYKDPEFVAKVIEGIRAHGEEFIGVFDAISSPETYENGLKILEAFGGGHLACVHPPPTEVPGNVKAGMIFAVDDVATPVWRDYVTPALQQGKLKCLPPPIIVGKGLDKVNEALQRCEAGVSGGKLVVEM
ncbi:Alcohol dehydrogenase superfamily, zinc-type [Cordyceps fumosorosea ARSEF 2679]|uniref:Alcohol dehydrogenase superfamily, zinc-type n=1 Tax=Cordyceps fumosorosea (strain ARSEF 2679) TaxID=1081104 RepID=A0A162LLQ2_CORFA|nr:Alcohol dehydrogenase superfamily, zinc-type [Cordyceps fumosorosea ARSEF 2679]OAA72474.1 Alcohol dehydrogenase superfamily, zinc-type [Cordyceps fumosorosea ARSEF 2679]